MTRQHVQPVNLCSRDTASGDRAFRSGLLATPTTVSKIPRGRCVNRVSAPPPPTSISKTKMGHENIFGRSVRYTRYNLYRITLFCNTSKKLRTDHVALSGLCGSFVLMTSHDRGVVGCFMCRRLRL